MRYDYNSGFDNFLLAQKTHCRSSFGRRFQCSFATWGVVAIGVTVLLATFLLHLPGMCGVIGFALIGAGVGNQLSRRWNMKRIYRAINGDPDGPLPVYLEIDGPVLISGIQGKSEGRFQRAAICSVVEDDEMILLYAAKKRFLYVRKAALAEEGVRELREWLALPGAPTQC